MDVFISRGMRAALISRRRKLEKEAKKKAERETKAQKESLGLVKPDVERDSEQTPPAPLLAGTVC